MTAAILCTGTELTRGELVNTNATWLADELTGLGFEVAALDVVDDDRERIQRALERLGAEHSVLVCTGGLGPTTDDLTTECVAALLGVGLWRDQASLQLIEEKLSRLGRKIAASNAKQADFPDGASIIKNPSGTAPGFSIRIGRALACFLPGVPHEMKTMFHESVVPAILPLRDEARCQVRLRTYGLAESEVNDRLSGIEAAHDVTIGYRAKMPEIEVKVLARAGTDDDAQKRARCAADEVRARLGEEIVFGEGDTELAHVIGTMLRERGQTLCTAESCTGGLVAELITATAGSSEYFLGGVVAYANTVKETVLEVPAELLARHGAVSREVATAMAEGARRRLGASHAIAVTGIAGPGGGTPEKPVGLVHYAVASDAGVAHKERVFPGTREQVRRRSAFAALALLRRILLHGHG